MQTNPITAAFGRAGVVFSIALLMAAQVQATSLSLTPAAQVASLGAPVEVQLQISQLGDGTAPSLGAFDLVISFDPAVLTFDSVAFGGMLSPVLGSVSDSMLDTAAGTLNLFEVSLELPATLDNGQPGQFLLASLHFSATGSGTSALNLSDVLLGDANGDPLLADNIQGASVTVRQGQAVPEGGMIAPGVFLLLFTLGSGRVLQRRSSRAN